MPSQEGHQGCSLPPGSGGRTGCSPDDQHQRSHRVSRGLVCLVTFHTHRHGCVSWACEHVGHHPFSPRQGASSLPQHRSPGMPAARGQRRFLCQPTSAWAHFVFQAHDQRLAPTHCRMPVALHADACRSLLERRRHLHRPPAHSNPSCKSTAVPASAPSWPAPRACPASSAMPCSPACRSDA